MPGLLAIIRADANPMRRELAAVQAMAAKAGVNIQRGLSGGVGGHSGSSGIVREFLVLSREISAGNWTRVPGSITILAQRLGILKLVMTDTASASRVLADAWQLQSEKASLAAIAAVRKAAASEAAFYADTEETEATLAQAVADEEGAAAAILNAKATQTKAVASAEAAATAGGGIAAGVGVVGIAIGALIGLAAGLYVGFKSFKNVVDTFSGLKFADFKPEYIAKHLKASSQAAEAQKEINREIQHSIDLYNSAAKSAERVSAVTKEHFEHLRKMNSYERNPALKAQREAEINAQERNANLANKIDEGTNLGIEGRNKKQQADAIKVSSKQADEERLKKLKEDADIAQKKLDDLHEGKGRYAAAAAALATGDFTGKEANEQREADRASANQRIQAYKDEVNKVASNDEKRKEKERLDKEAGTALSKSAEIKLEAQNEAKTNKQKTADEQDELAKELMSKSKLSHGSVNSLQQIGAFTAPAAQLAVANKQLMHLASIDRKLGVSQGGQSDMGGVKY